MKMEDNEDSGGVEWQILVAKDDGGGGGGGGGDSKQ